MQFVDERKSLEKAIVDDAARLLTQQGRLAESGGMMIDIVFRLATQEYDERVPAKQDFRNVISEEVLRSAQVNSAECILTFFNAVQNRALGYCDNPPDFDRIIRQETLPRLKQFLA